MIRQVHLRFRPIPQRRTVPAWPIPRFGWPSALQIADYRRFWTGSGLAFLARLMDIAVVSWVVVQITESPFLVSLVAVVRIIPFLVSGPIAGLAADRFDRLRIIKIARLCLAGSYLIFAVLIATGALQLWHLYILVAFGGVVWTFDAAARQSLTPDLVDRRILTSAIALDMMAFMGGQIAGSLLAGVLLPIIHAEVCFVLLVGLLGISIMRLSKVISPGAAENEREPILSSLAAGIRVVRANRMLLAVLLMNTAAEGFAYTFQPLIPVFATKILDAGASGLGLLLAGQATGALIAGSVVAVLGTRVRSPGRVMVVTMLLAVATGFGLALSHSLMLTFGLLVLQGIFVGTYLPMQTNLLMLHAPREVRGRLVGLQMLVVGAFPISSIIVGAIADAYSPQTAILVMSGIGIGAMVLIQVFVPQLRRYRVVEEEEPVQAQAPQPATGTTTPGAKAA